MTDHPSIIKQLSELDGRKLKFEVTPAENGLGPCVMIYDMESGGNWLAAMLEGGKWFNGVGGKMGETYD